eukprot:7531056-Pyramimonas_sp.AAC.1
MTSSPHSCNASDASLPLSETQTGRPGPTAHFRWGRSTGPALRADPSSSLCGGCAGSSIT